MPQAIVVGVAAVAKAITVKAVASFALKAAASFALSAAARSLTKKKAAAQERQAMVNTLSMGESPREFVFGLTCTAGSLVDVFNFGGQHGTDTASYCIALADHAIEGIVGYYVDDRYYAWSGQGLQPALSNKLSILFFNATPDGHLQPQHVRQYGGWTTNDRLAGLSFVWVDVHNDEKVWAQGLPKIRFVLRGMRVYDPRYDTRFGYTGPTPMTWEDRSTHRFSRNPALIRYAYQRGIYAEGRQGQAQHLLIGRGLSEVEAPPQRVIAAANLCDEHVNGVSRYYVDGLVSADMDFITVEDLFASATAGVIVQREGGVELEPGQAKAAVATITDEDLVADEQVEFSAFLPDKDGGRINSVIPRYVSAAHAYQEHSGPIRREYADILADGGPREITLSLPIVVGPEVADRVAEITRRLARFERRGGFVLPPEYSRLEEGDWVIWQSARYLGGLAVRFRIESYLLGKDWRMRLKVREIAASAFGQVEPEPDQSALPPPPPSPSALTLSDFEVTALPNGGEGGSSSPAIKVVWSTPDAAIKAIRVDVRPVGQTEIFSTLIEDVASGEKLVDHGVGPDMDIEVRLVPIGQASREATPTAWLARTTPGSVATDTTKVGGVPASSIAHLLNVEFPTVLDDLEEARSALFTATTGLVDQTAALVAQLNAPTVGIAARLVAAESKIETNNGAAVTRLEALETSVNTPGSGLLARTAGLETATINLQSGKADASRVTLLEAQASGLVGAAASSLTFYPTSPTWTDQTNVGGAPSVRRSVSEASIVNGVVAPPMGDALVYGPKQYIRWETGRIYDFLREIGGGPVTANARLVVSLYDASFVRIAQQNADLFAAPANTITPRSYKIGMGVDVSGGLNLAQGGAEWISVGVQLNRNAAGNTVGTSQQTINSFSWRDTTTAEATATLTARTAASETAIVNLQQGKADVSRVALLEARADTLAYGDIFAAYQFRDNAVHLWGATNATLTGGVAFALYAQNAAGSADGQLYRGALNFPGSRFTRVVVDLERIAARTTGIWDGFVFWHTSGHGAASGFKMKAMTPDPALNVRTEVVFDVDLSPQVDGGADWKASTITGLRIDLDQGLGGQFRIYSIRVLGPDGARLAAGVSSLETAVLNLQTGKADASLVTEVRALASRGDTVLNANPNFSDWPTGQALPTSYSPWVTGGTFARAAGLNGAPNSLRAASASQANHGHMTAILNGAAGGGEWLVAESEFTLVSGDLRGAGVSVQFYDASNVGAKTTDARSFATVADASGVVRGAGVAGQTYRYKFLVDGRAANVVRYRMIEHTRNTSLGNIGAATIDWHRHALRPATPEEVAAGTTLPAVQASVVVLQAAAADLYGRTQARWAVGAAVPGATAFMYAQAETTPGGVATSNVGIGGRMVALYSQSGDTWLRTLSVSGGNVLIEGVLQATVAIRLGNGQGWPIARGAVEFNVADGEVVSFGTDLGAIPQISYAMNNLLPMNAGETPDVRATSLTPTGFTMRAKFNIPATPSAYDRTDPTGTTEFGSGGRKIDKTAQPVSTDGTYRLTGSLSNRHQFVGLGFFPDPGGDIDNDYNYQTGVLEVWVRRTGSSAWTLASQLYLDTMMDRKGFPQGQFVTVAGSVQYDETLNLGDNVEQIGVRHAQHGTAAEYAAYLTRLRWTATGSGSGVRSALAAGATTRVTVRPI